LRKVKSTLIFVLLGLTTAVVVVSLLVTLFLPTLLRRFACAPYGIRCAAGQAKIHLHLNLITNLVIHNLTVFEQDGRGVVLQAKRLAVTLDLPRLILTRRMMPTEVRIDRPKLLLRQLDDGRWNLLALVQEVRKHWRPTTRVSPVQFPSISINAGAVQIGARRVTDLNLSLEPKPAPQLFGVQVRAAVEGRPIQVTGVVSESLEGEVQVQGPEITLTGAARSWKPRAALRFRLDLTAHSLNISEWTLEDEGAMARGTAAIRYAEVMPDKIRGWRAGAMWRNWLPKFTVSLDRSRNQTIASATSSGKTTFSVGPEDESYKVGFGFTWDFANLVWNPDQISIDNRSRLMVQLRQDILEEVTRLYFERKRLLAEFQGNPTGDTILLHERDLRVEEATAQLDALTGGWFSLHK